MNIHYTTHPVFILFFMIAGLLAGLPATGQTNCDNPVVISSILISNATCGNPTGTIILNLSSGAYQFNWSPSVSISNVASNLQAGTYSVQIVRADNQNCKLDTTIIVNNSNGPAVQTNNVTPANCLASNGKVTLTPSNLSYIWSNGETGAINDGLASGCYYVTATNAGGCYSVHKICVPNTNPLQSSVVVLQNGKCGLPTGAANVIVTGGSSQYTYTLGTAPPFTGLAATLYFCGIADVVTGCTSEVSFIIEDIPVNAIVDIETSNVQCPGGGNASVQVSVTPGDNFTLPFTAVVTNENGMEIMPDALAAGRYFLQISDADGCSLPLDTFLITAPSLFVSQALVVPVNCDSDGEILLTISGGTGPIQVDWLDLPGVANPQNRQHLEAGLYSAVAYDSLQCSFPINPILVSSTCIQTDTVHFQVTINTLDTFCMELPVGIQPNAATFSLPGNGGNNSGNSIFGSWVLKPGGCLIYAAGNTLGTGVDTICIARTVNLPGLNDTLCLIVSIVEQNCSAIIQLPQSLTVPTTECGTPTAVCIPVPYATINNFKIFDNGLPYSNSLLGCALDTVTAYMISLLPPNGPFQLTGWSVNGQNLNGNFLNINALLILINQLDPSGDWIIKNNAFIIGGHPNNTYGALQVLTPQNGTVTLPPLEQYIARGTELRLSTGAHSVIVQDMLSACADTVQITVNCFECPPIHNYLPDLSGIINWSIAQCLDDTLFCSNIPNDEWSTWTITDNQLPVFQHSACGELAGFRVDTGFHLLQFRNTQTTCSYTVRVNVSCQAMNTPTDTTYAVADVEYTNRGTSIDISLLENDIILGIAGNIGGIGAIEFLNTPIDGSFSYNPVDGVLTFSPGVGQCGLVSFTYQITDTLGQSSTALVSITIICDKILIYNGISPNGDNLNDEWHLPGIDQYPNNEVRVFNRWGEQVFERKGYTNAQGWDGRWNGRDLPDGTYYYMIDLKDGSAVLSGFLQILR